MHTFICYVGMINLQTVLSLSSHADWYVLLVLHNILRQGKWTEERSIRNTKIYHAIKTKRFHIYLLDIPLLMFPFCRRIYGKCICDCACVLFSKGFAVLQK